MVKIILLLLLFLAGCNTTGKRDQQTKAEPEKHLIPHLAKQGATTQ